MRMLDRVKTLKNVLSLENDNPTQTIYICADIDLTGARLEAVLVRMALALRRPLYRVPLLLVFVAVVSGSALARQPAVAAHPGSNGKIAYVHVTPIDESVVSTNLNLIDGVNDASPTELSQGALSFAPAWSPGGTLLAFAEGGRCEGSHADIALFDANGAFLGSLTNDDCSINEAFPDWSPDGSRIAFTRNDNIYSIRPDGGGLTQLTSGGGTHPAWSPDGTRIAFTSYRRGAWELFLLDLTATGTDRLTRLTDNMGLVRDDFDAEWSPDGTTLLWTRSIDYVGDIYRMSPVQAGSAATPFIATAAHEQQPAYSPDGTQLLYVRGAMASGGADVFVDDADNPGSPTQVTTAAPGRNISPSWQPIPEFPLVDARFSPFESAIRWIYQEGIASGCSLERFCPDSKVTRGQMAVFLDRALDLPPAGVDYFADDEGRTFEAAINRVREAGIAFGCTPTTYCPDAPVSRGQMAAFLDRARDLPATNLDYFTDDEGRSFEGAINRVRAGGIAFGCTATTYCPDAVVRRGQMAAFLYRALAP